MATETWVLNETLSNSSLSLKSVTFNSNNKSYVGIERYYDDNYEQGLRYYTNVTASLYDLVYANQGSGGAFFDQSDRTITFAESVTDATLLSWLQANGTKKVIPKVSIDLSTSTKWANLADGDHVVKLKARGTGFGSSSFSNSVTVRKGV